jgi:hypothetical protein
MKILFKKNQDWMFLNAPGAIMFMGAYGFQDARPFLLSSLGYSALFFFVSVLLLNPLIAVFPTVVRLKKINRHRRTIGMVSFFHAFLYIEKKGMSFFTKWIFHPVLLPGFLALGSVDN